MSILLQYQSFIKHAPDATLRFVVTEATMEALDHNDDVLGPFECMYAHLPDAAKLCEGVMQSFLAFRCEIYFENRIIAPIAGAANMSGWAGNWHFDAWAEVDAKPALDGRQLRF